MIFETAQTIIVLFFEKMKIEWRVKVLLRNTNRKYLSLRAEWALVELKSRTQPNRVLFSKMQNALLPGISLATPRKFVSIEALHKIAEHL